MGNSVAIGRLQFWVTMLLATAVLILVVLVASGVIEIHYTGRSDSAASLETPSPRPETEKPPTPGPQIARVEGIDLVFEMLGSRYTGDMFRYSGTLIDCELEVETDGEKKIVGTISGNDLMLLEDEDKDPNDISGYVLFVGRPVPLVPKVAGEGVLDPTDDGVPSKEVWDLLAKQGTNGRIDSGLGIRGVQVPWFEWDDDPTTRGSNPVTTSMRLGTNPVELTGEVILWERRFADEVAAKEGKFRQIIRLKCRPVVATNSKNHEG